ncbi:hypothetical protein CDAR_302941 [Caerostris darwini]|uniref:Uncharacterized protein n=1 Tax=Caerostris darwini TaxID=1538125 RepID=A0AAV4V410_9ARAC|nr:hypothetical protein CDAR_302941 [Caerostris darwini]
MSSFIAASKASDIRLSESQKPSQSFERHSRHDLNVGRAPFGFFYKQGHHLVICMKDSSPIRQMSYLISATKWIVSTFIVSSCPEGVCTRGDKPLVY